jgi:hypothetical protein
MKLPYLRKATWLKTLFDRYRWYRRLAGGKWERWYVDMPVCSDLWHDVRNFTREYVYAAERMGYRPPLETLGKNMYPHWWGYRPTPLCRGTPIEEDWS